MPEEGIFNYTNVKTWCMFIVKSYIKNFTNIYIYCGIKYRTNSLHRWKIHRLCVQHFKLLYENVPCSVFHTALDYHSLYSQHEWKGTHQFGSTYIFQICFNTYSYLTDLYVFLLLTQPCGRITIFSF